MIFRQHQLKGGTFSCYRQGHSSTPSAATRRRSKTLPVPFKKSLTSVIKPSSFPPFPNRLSRSRSVKFATARAFSIVLTHSDPERILHDTDALIKEHDILAAAISVLAACRTNTAPKSGFPHFISDFKEPAKKSRRQESFSCTTTITSSSKLLPRKIFQMLRLTAGFWNIFSRLCTG